MSLAFRTNIPARDPISGLIKVERDSLSDFARRHGWTVKESKGPDDHFTEAWYSKDGERVRAFLSDRIPITALANRIDVPRDDVQTRVEKYLAGVPCRCVFDPDEPHISPDCSIHGED